MCEVKNALAARLSAARELTSACACEILRLGYEFVANEPVPEDMLERLGALESEQEDPPKH